MISKCYVGTHIVSAFVFILKVSPEQRPYKDVIQLYSYCNREREVPEAIIAFLESKDFEDAVRNAVSLGGDTDTLGAITGSIAEAFYGIPAVLIAECKSRIDKGLMTDVLDEFDHVLGRSMDTYSDEMDETQANQMIEAAIDKYY